MIQSRVCEDNEQWDEAVLDSAGNPLQLWGWGELKASHGWTVQRYLAVDSEDVIGGVQVLVKSLPFPFKSLSYAPRGPFGFNGSDQSVLREEFLNKVANDIKSKYGSVSFSIEPDNIIFEIGDSWQKSSNKILPAETIILDTSKPEDHLLSKMAKKTRQYIRKSSSVVDVRLAKIAEDIDVCLNLYKQTAKRADFAVHSDDYYRDVSKKLGDHAPIFIAYSDNKPVAFLWLAISAETAYELYGGVNEEGQKLRANYALKWHAIQKCKEWGINRYDFGGMVAGGVANFKGGWSENETVLAGTFDKKLSPLYVIWHKLMPVAKKIVQKLRNR